MRIRGILDSYAAALLAGGLGLALVINALAWRRDRKRLAEVKALEKPLPPLPSTPLVTFLVPAWNEVQNLAACVESILALRYPSKQLIVCAGGTDGTLELAQHYENEHVLVLQQYPGGGKQGALHTGFKQATGEIIFLTDADCILDDECVERTLKPLICDGEDAATGAWRPLDCQLDHPFAQYQWAHHVYREVMMPEYAPTLDGRNAAVRRHVVEETGGFAVEAPIGTDYVISRQIAGLGYRIRFARHSHVQTIYPETPQAYWSQQSRWFRNRLLLGLQWGDSSSTLSAIRAGVPSFFLVGLPAIGGLGSRFLWVIWLSLVSHLVLSSWRFSQMLRLSTGIRPGLDKSFRFVVFLPIGWIAMARGFLDSVRPAHAKEW